MIYDIRQHLDVLERSFESSTKYECPVCEGNHLDINPDTGVYKCFTTGCKSEDIRKAIDKLEGKTEWKPEQFTKTIRLQATKDYFYPDRSGQTLVKVARKDDGKGGKKFYQNHWGGSQWTKGNPDGIKKQIPIYRYQEIQQAIERNEVIFWVEGESTADALWDLGIAATTTIGGSGGYATYGDYSKDLKDARLILSPDRDSSGLKYIANIERDFPQQIEGYYLAGTQNLWATPEGGMDIGDDINDHQLTKEQVLDKVIAPDKYQQAVGKQTETSGSPKANKRPHFTSSIDEGLVKISFKTDENTGELKQIREHIGHHITAVACVDNPEQDGDALLLEFQTYKGATRRWTMLSADLAGDGTKIVEGLLSRGYRFDRKKKSILLDYMQGLGSDVEQTYTVTDSSGWVKESFVLPHKTHGDSSLKFRDIEPSPESLTDIKGTLQGWIDNVAARCAGNSRMLLGLGASFAAPLLPIIDIESGGFHLVGVSSQGKTTILSVAASVTGVKDLPHWRTTTNGLESTATAFNHLCLPLDEIAQADAKDVGNIAYMLANGQGKARMKKDLTTRKAKTWRLLVLSSGEVGLGQYMAQAGITQKGGQEVRLPDVPAVPQGSIYGCFETIHGAETSAQFVGALDAAVKEYRGTALDAFLSRLVVDVTDRDFVGNLSKQVQLISAKLSEGTIDSAIGRVAKRFALVQVALGLAHKYGLLPFEASQIGWGISTCFKAWLESRGGDGSIEIKQAISRIEHLLVTNEFSDRIYDVERGANQQVRNLLGYRCKTRAGGTELLVPPSVFDKEFADGVNKAELVKELSRIGWLDLSAEGKTRPRTVDGMKGRYYVFTQWKRATNVNIEVRNTADYPEVITLITPSSPPSDDKVMPKNLDTKRDSAKSSPSSPSSPLKTRFPISVSENSSDDSEKSVEDLF